MGAKNLFCAATAGVVALLTVSSAGATVVSSLNGTVIPMPAVNYNGPGPQVFDGGEVTWSSTTYGAFGYTGGYGFGTNGNWDGSLGPMAGVNAQVGTMTFSFTTPVTAVGGFLNDYAYYGPGGAVASVYSPADVLLETTDLTFQTGGGLNSGQFVGFVDVGPIGSLTLSNSDVALVNLTVGTIPEPSTWAMMLIGFAGLGFAGYRASHRAAVA
jgi:hypothetical protein